MSDFPIEIFEAEGELLEEVERINTMLADAGEDSRWKLICMPVAEYEDGRLMIAEIRKHHLAQIERREQRKHLRVVS